MVGRMLVLSIAAFTMLAIPLAEDVEAHGRIGFRAPVRANFGVGYSRSFVFQRSFQKSYVAPIAFQKSYYVSPYVASYAYAAPYVAPVQYTTAPPVQYYATAPCPQPVQYQMGCAAYFAAPVAYASVGYSAGCSAYFRH